MTAPFDDLVLLVPNKPDTERDAVADAWQRAGGAATRLDRFWEPPPLPRERVRLYGPLTFALVVAQKLGLELAEPDPYLLCKCPGELLQRTTSLERLGDAEKLRYPCFLKPVVPKQFTAAVFHSPAELRASTSGLDDATELLRSDVVNFVAEARSFVFDGSVQACALYEGRGDISAAAATATRIAAALPLPRASVVDVGLLPGGHWVFLEANAAWGSGLNGCAPDDILLCLAAATFAR